MKFFISLILLFLSVMASARPSSQLVLPLENLLVQGIPSRLTDSVPKDALIRIQTDDNRIYFFAIRPGVREFLEKALKSNYKIDIYSSLPKDSVGKMLKAIAVNGKDLSVFAGKVLTQEDLVDKKLDFSKWHGQKNAPLVVTAFGPAGRSVKEMPLLIDLGQTFYYYTNFASVEANRNAKAPDAAYFAPDEKAWYAERFKLGRLHLLLQDLENLTDAQFAKTWDSFNKEDQEKLARIGTQMLEGKFKAQTSRYIFSPDKSTVVGCEMIEARSERVSGPASMSQCVNDNNPNAYWVGRDKKTCAYFTKEFARLQAAADGCKKEHVYFLKSEKSWIVFEHEAEFDKLDQKQFEEAIAGGKPTQKDYLQVWRKTFKKNKLLDLSSCRRSRGSYQLINLEKNECKPDTLYSWGPMQKIIDLKKQMGSGSWNSRLVRSVYLARSPLPTFGYGDYAIRVKLKPDVIYVNSGYYSCNGSVREQNSVFYRADEIYQDWVICSPNVIHSWSYGTKLHYDEMVRDQIPRNARNRDVDFYASQQYQLATIIDISIDNHVFSESALKRNFLNMLKLIENKAGEIFYNPDLDANEKSEGAHFRTASPVYFNEE